MNDWDRLYQQLVDFRNCFGHTDVPLQGQYRDLARWVSQQKCRYKNYKAQDEVSPDDSMTLEEITLLHAINFDFESDPTDDQPDTTSTTFSSRRNSISAENEGHEIPTRGRTLIPRLPREDIGLMDIADAYVIRAVLHSPERRRAHNELMHSSHRALFAESVNRTANEFSESNQND